MNPQINELAAVLFAVNCKTKPKQTSLQKNKNTQANDMQLGSRRSLNTLTYLLIK